MIYSSVEEFLTSTRAKRLAGHLQLISTSPPYRFGARSGMVTRRDRGVCGLVKGSAKTSASPVAMSPCPGSTQSPRRGGSKRPTILVTFRMQRFRLPVHIRAEDGHGGGAGEVEVAKPPLRRRLWKAGLLFLVGLGAGVLLLPIPLIHLFGVMFFLGMSTLAARRLLSRSVLKGAHGTCPSCNADGDYFVGMGGRRLAFPIVTSCPHCHVELQLERAASQAFLPAL
jgi:hypothetical protein